MLGPQILPMKDVPTSEADTLGDRFSGVHPERKFRIVLALRNLERLTGTS